MTPKARDLFALFTMIVAASAHGDSHTSPEETLKRFCELNVDGMLLSAEGRAQEGELFVHPRASAIRTDRIAVVKGFTVKRDRMDGNQASLVVDYVHFGYLDASLHFTRIEGREPQAPVTLEDDFILVRDAAQAPSSTEAWKILNDERRLRLGFDAATRYVSRARDAAHDPAIVATADRTLQTLERLVAGETVQPATRVDKSAQAALITYCSMDAAGKQLTHEGWREISSLFAEPGQQPRTKSVDIIKDFAISKASIADDDTATVTAEFLRLAHLDLNTGQLESQPALSEGGIMTRVDFSLRLSREPSSSAVATWKIAGPVPNPRVTVDAALRLLTGLRDRTTDAVVKRNASRTLVTLARQR